MIADIPCAAKPAAQPPAHSTDTMESRALYFFESKFDLEKIDRVEAGFARAIFRRILVEFAETEVARVRKAQAAALRELRTLVADFAMGHRLRRVREAIRAIDAATKPYSTRKGKP